MISIDTVYQRVLAILNKEQRGFITPQQFNLYANQAQLDIFKSYFYDLEYYLNLPGNDTVVADMVNILETKISYFEKEEATPGYIAPYFSLPSDNYRLRTVHYNGNVAQRVSLKEFLDIQRSKLASPSNAFPVYTESTSGVKALGDALFTDLDTIAMLYIKKPDTAEWAYTSVLGTEVYNANNSTDFELEPEEETEVTIKILALAGLEVKDLSVYEVANREDLTEQQIKKQ